MSLTPRRLLGVLGGARATPGDGGDAELEAALRVARYWEAHPERLAEALRWPHENGRS